MPPKEWKEAQAVWQGDFRIEPSVTDAEAGILVGYLTGMQENFAKPSAKRQHRK